MLNPGKYEILTFQTDSGELPYLEWLKNLDFKTRGRIVMRVARMEHGQFGDYKTIDRGLYELRLFFGPGYRVYFGEHRGKTILLLSGGDKSSQSRDINKAKEYWKIYLENNE